MAVNEVQVSKKTFASTIRDFVVYTTRVQFVLVREATGALLRQRQDLRSRTHATPASLKSSAVTQRTKLYAARSKGCLARTTDHAGKDECPFCGTRRTSQTGFPVKQVVYWSLVPWLTAMLADPDLGPEMVPTTRRARQAASQPMDDIPEWYDGATFRKLDSDGFITADTDVALSNSTDGFKAWRQQSFHLWPIIVTVLNLAPSCRFRFFSQPFLCFTRGPDQPAALESFLHPIVGELDRLSEGISGVKVAGIESVATVKGCALQVTGDMPAGDKVLNNTGISGRTPGRPRKFQIIHSGSKYYIPPTDPSTKQELFSLTRLLRNRRNAASFAADARRVAIARDRGATQNAVSKLVRSHGVPT